ncbi:hypothetical protein U2I54_26965 [Bacillus pseudomycoides]|uniref:Class I SAM-dependent methyltransferase n=1 Tax=Bacillus bingmayongensis TaxID=1150157 RepID=A0ABU5K494_9BACI|nr:hypothetical protein [Bacillus pseudomycoides]
MDGDHEYNSVKRDIFHYVPKVVNGGVITFHHYSDYWPGIYKAVKELCNNNKDTEYIAIYDTLIIIHKLKA